MFQPEDPKPEPTIAVFRKGTYTNLSWIIFPFEFAKLRSDCHF